VTYFVDKVSVDKVSVDKVSVDKVSVGKVSAGQLSLDKMSRQNVCRQNVCRETDVLPLPLSSCSDAGERGRSDDHVQVGVFVDNQSSRLLHIFLRLWLRHKIS
jgi:hypothetical protein